MLLVKTKIGVSKIHGIGLFADEFVPKGKQVWVYHSGFDQKFEAQDILVLPKVAQEQILHYSYVNASTGKIVLCADDARYFNHSSDPTTIEAKVNDEEGASIAARDIQVGEELTYDYVKNDADGERKLRGAPIEESPVWSMKM